MKRKPPKKQNSKIRTSTPIGKELEAAEEKKRLREESLKRKNDDKTDKKKLVRRCFSSETTSNNKLKGKKRMKKDAESDSSDDSVDEELSDICGDDELDDVELSFIPPPLPKPSIRAPTIFVAYVGNLAKTKYGTAVCCVLHGTMRRPQVQTRQKTISVTIAHKTKFNFQKKNLICGMYCNFFNQCLVRTIP